MAIHKLKNLYRSKPEYGAALPALSSGKYKYVRQTDIKNKIFNTYVNSGPLLKEGEILISRVGSNAGESYIHYSNEKCVFAGFLVRYNFDNKKINNKYFYYWTKTNKYQNQVKKFITGSGQPQFNPPIVSELVIFVPKIKYQNQIIDIIEPLENLENNIFLQLNQINSLLKRIKNSSQEIKLSNILEPIKNPPKNLKQVSAKVLMKNTTIISNFEEKGTYSTNSFFCPAGTFLFCSIRTYLQKYCILPEDADVNGTLMQFKIKENFISLLKALKSEEFWKKTNLLSAGTKMPVLSKKDFLNIKIKKTSFEIKDLEKLLVTQNKILIKLTKLKETIINLLIK